MDVVQQWEQLLSHLMNLGPTVYSYYEELKRQGFTEEQAMQLAVACQKSLIEATSK
ncbi:hypothetical protein ACRC6Q_16680 [Planococcus sp. SE5232]|uniref:hypothetical protein n=1 Tax=unclassified Planococcus (in: firmicutes) TaxID=2662419 RepID=UPI003D6AE2DD